MSAYQNSSTESCSLIVPFSDSGNSNEASRFCLSDRSLNLLRDEAAKFGTQSALAEAVGMPKPTLQKLLAGDTDPAFSRVARLAHFLGLSLDDIAAGVITPRPRFQDRAESAPPSRIAFNALASANAFRIAIDALPVGKDIRGRLHAHLERHIADLEAIVLATAQ